MSIIERGELACRRRRVFGIAFSRGDERGERPANIHKRLGKKSIGWTLQMEMGDLVIAEIRIALKGLRDLADSCHSPTRHLGRADRAHRTAAVHTPRCEAAQDFLVGDRGTGMKITVNDEDRRMIVIQPLQVAARHRRQDRHASRIERGQEIVEAAVRRQHQWHRFEVVI